MRMMKRAAVGLLAAAMALSMLTACGGASAGPSSSGSNSTGGSSTSSSSSSSGSESNVGSSSSSSSGSSSSSTKFTYKDSLTYKYNMMRYNSKTWYEKTDLIEDGEQNIYESAIVFNSEHRVQKSYYKNSYKSSSSNGTTYESLTIGGTHYTLYRDAKVATTSIHKSSGDSSSSSDGEIYKMESIDKTTQKVNDISYYTEVMTYKGDKTGKTMTSSYCFDTKGKLVYIIMVEDGKEFKTHLLDYSTTIPSSAIMEIPNDWSVYTFDYTTTPKTVTDAAGNKLTDDEIIQLNEKLYK